MGKKQKAKLKKRAEQNKMSMGSASGFSMYEEYASTLATTATGEIFQPIRLDYQILDKQKLSDIFSQLRCMHYDVRIL